MQFFRQYNCNFNSQYQFSVCLSVCLCIYGNAYLSVYLLLYISLFVYLFTYIYNNSYLSVYPSIFHYLAIYLTLFLSSLSVCSMLIEETVFVQNKKGVVHTKMYLNIHTCKYLYKCIYTQTYILMYMCNIPTFRYVLLMWETFKLSHSYNIWKRNSYI